MSAPVPTTIDGLPTLTINSLNAANSIDAVNDYLPIYTASATATQKINRNTLLGITSQPVGLTDSQTLTNKTLTSPAVSNPVLSGTITGTYTIGGTPTFPSSVTTLTGSQTLTNKTLTSPTINSPTITNATLSADAITGYTVSNTGTIYGISVSTGTITTSNSVSGAALTTNSIPSGVLQTNAVAAANLATNAIKLGFASINSAVTITPTANIYTDVAGLSVTVTVPSGGRDLLIIFKGCVQSAAAAGQNVAVAITDATSGVVDVINWDNPVSAYKVASYFSARVSAPSAGSHTYKIQGSHSVGATNLVFSAGNGLAPNSGLSFIMVLAV